MARDIKDYLKKRVRSFPLPTNTDKPMAMSNVKGTRPARQTPPARAISRISAGYLLSGQLYTLTSLAWPEDGQTVSHLRAGT